MTKYFRRLIPILHQHGKYWTEFVLTPESKVLRRVLLEEFKMKPLAVRPAAYYNNKDGKLLSGLTAYDPRTEVIKSINIISSKSDHINTLAAILQNKNVKFDSITNISLKSSNSYCEKRINANEEVETLVTEGMLPIGIVPYKNDIIFAKWPKYNFERISFILDENILELSTFINYFMSIQQENT